MRIAILGTRGIPNHYGGFEQFAEYLSLGLVAKGHSVFVYNSHDHPFKESTWNGVHILHKYDPEKKLGTSGQFIYDLNCIIHSRKQQFDIILNLGYTSSSIWSRLFPKKSVLITNMDGLEWKRSKYSKKVQKFLLYAEKLAIRHSQVLVADSPGIQHYISHKYQQVSHFIPYGASVFEHPDQQHLAPFALQPFGYNMLIARMEPENNIEMILDGMAAAKTPRPFLVIGNCKNKFGQYLVDKYKNNAQIKFLGPIYNMVIIDNLRYYSHLYFHGHSVGGTNPSLLEAMGSSALVAAHNNEFNRYVLGNDAFYFNTVQEVTQLLEQNDLKTNSPFIKNNLQKISSTFAWPNIIDQYEQLMLSSL